MKDIKQIHDKKYKHIFVDIFDTIISRKTQPEYTKKIWANHLKKHLSIEKYSILDIYKIRNSIEYKLGETSVKSGNDWEFTYDDLLNEIYDKLKIKIDIAEFKKIAVEIELNIEKSVAELDNEILKELEIAKNKGKKIYCISDMYLSKKMIEELFKNLGIINIFDNIFLSCEYKASKQSTKLYDVVLDELGIKPNSCIMIGDNEVSDYTNAKSKGFAAVKLDKTEQYDKYIKYDIEHSSEKVLSDFYKLKNSQTNNFEHAIFTLYKFTENLYYQLIRDGFDEVFFLSREGEYLKKLFDSFNDKIYGKKIKSHYILVSRKATYLPSLKKLDNEDFSVLLNQYKDISISEFLGSLNFTKEERETILESYCNDCKKIDNSQLNDSERESISKIISKDYNTKIIGLSKTKLLEILKNNKDFKKIYEKNRIEQNNLFCKYIKQFTENKEICVVDIGWNGSIQDNIQNILGNSYKVTGYLYGLVSRNPGKCKNKQGLIFSNVPNPSNNYQLYIENRTIYEVLLGASHGSANRYTEKNGKVEVTTFEKEEEKKIYLDVVSKIQNNMLKIYNSLELLFINGYYDDKKIDKEINKIHFNMLFKPNKEQLRFFNKIYHYENFGVFEFSKFGLNKKITLKYYIKENAKFFLRRKVFFYDTFWPTLKLYNERLYIPKLLYMIEKKVYLKKKGII